jgi:hypothetical protein
MKKKVTKSKLAVGLAFSAGEILALYLAVNGSAAAENIISFWCIFAGMCGILLILASGTAAKVYTFKPAWYNRLLTILDIGIIVTIAGQGWFWCASMFLVGIIGPAIIQIKAQELIEKKKPTE